MFGLRRFVSRSRTTNGPARRRCSHLAVEALEERYLFTANPIHPPPHNKLGSITWEKRNQKGDLLGGATFSVTPNPFTGTGSLIVVDNGSNDADRAAGVIKVADVPTGDYTIAEVAAPRGFQPDSSTRSVSVTDRNLNVVIGIKGCDDRKDFHNIPLGCITWEKRDNKGALLGGATFSVTPDPTTGGGSLTVVDNGANDANPTAGVITVRNVLNGTYTIAETAAPAGYFPDTSTRTVTVDASHLNVVIGSKGYDDRKDFHNTPAGTITWEKRDNNGAFLGGATFSVTPNPSTGSGSLTVVDNGTGDADPTVGVIQVINVRIGTYTIAETAAPAGFTRDTTTRTASVTADNPNVVIGVPGDDPYDFHNTPAGSITWEKRDNNGAFLGGATFSVTPDPTTGTGSLTVVDNGANDADPTAGVVKVINVLIGTYTIAETAAPVGFAPDLTTRTATVAASNPNVVIGVAGDDRKDFHNTPAGSITWEKRDLNGNLQGGATFSVTPNPVTGTGSLTVVDNGASDADPTAGIIKVTSARIGSYTIVETIAPVGFLVDPAPRTVDVTAGNLNATIGVTGDDPRDFHDTPAGSITWEKRDGNGALLGGATFTITPSPFTGANSLTVVDNGANDANPTAGVVTVNGVLIGSYQITETTAPPGFTPDTTPRTASVTASNLHVTIGVSGDDPQDFHNLGAGSVTWEKRDLNGNLLGGATFTVTPNPLTGAGALAVLDNGPFDASSTPGVILINHVLVGSYTVLELFAPVGFVPDGSSRTFDVTVSAPNAVIGTPGVDDTQDFHNTPAGSITWEKRDGKGVRLGGATFTITPSPFTGGAALTVVDNGINDADPTPGVIRVNKVLIGTYTIAETKAPAGFVRDTSTRTAIVSASNLNAVIGTLGVDDAQDFHNLPPFSKRDFII